MTGPSEIAASRYSSVREYISLNQPQADAILGCLLAVRRQSGYTIPRLDTAESHEYHSIQGRGARFGV